MGAFSDLRLSFRRAVLLTALLSASVFAAGAGAQPTVVTHSPFFAVIGNPCTAEAVTLTGFIHTETDTTGGKFRIQMNLQDVKGTTVAGVRYVSKNTVSAIVNDLPPGSTANGEASNHMVRQAEDGTFPLGDDFMLKARAQFVVNANGVTTVSNFEVTTDFCQ
jgi:hypothetical protein